jgi:aldose sugar dehydrogenase
LNEDFAMTTVAMPRTKPRRGRLFRFVRAGLIVLATFVVVLFAYIQIFGIGALINAGPAKAAATAAQAGVSVQTVAAKLDHPWSLAFMPDGRMLVTERTGALRYVSRGGVVSAPLRGLPAVAADGQGGLFDVVLAPDFATTRQIYFAYAESDTKNPALNGTAIARATLGESGIAQVQVIYRQTPKKESSAHFGGRLVFDKDAGGKPVLFATLGDRFDFKELAQDLPVTLGKVIRIYPDGSIPADNPFVSKAGARPEIWSYGHRNPQAAALNPASGDLWTVEHGPRGGDEVNITSAGKNYGWPVITWGRDYSGVKIGIGTTKAGMEQPLHMWNPSIAPSGMAFVTSDKYPGWQGSLLVGALAHQRIARLVLDGNKVLREEQFLGDLGERIRDIRQGPDGYIYLLTDSENGRLLKLVPKG